MGSEWGGVLFWVLAFTSLGVAIYRARDEPPWKIVAALMIGFASAAAFGIAFLWAGIDATLVVVAITWVLAALALALRAARRSRSASHRGPFDFR